MFNEGDLVMVHLHKNRFPANMYYKLKDKKFGHSCVFHKIGDNAYKIDLPTNMNIFNTFNVANIFEYFPPDEFSSQPQNSRTSFLQVEGIDATHDHHQFPILSLFALLSLFPISRKSFQLSSFPISNFLFQLFPLFCITNII